MVTGKGGLKVFFNGLLVLADPFRGSFAAIKNGDHNYLGRNNWRVSSTELDDLEGALDYEAYIQEIAGASQDHREGVQAFMEKRAAKYVGK